MTHLRDPISQLPSRLQFATHICDPHLRLAVFMTTPSCDPPLTDGLCQHPSVITLAFQPIPNLNKIWNFLSCLASNSSYCPPPCPPPLMALCLLTLPLAHPLLQRHLPGPLPTSPHLSHPLPLPPFPLYGNMLTEFQPKRPLSNSNPNG